MAKQRGLHQIIGKYNDTCYFERKGTRGGLLRRINSAMSDRVKVEEAFTNLRAANSVFGACSMYASLVLNMFSTRGLFLFKKNRQSTLTKLFFKTGGTSFLSNEGKSAGFSHTSSILLAQYFDSVVKNKFFEIFSGVSRVVHAAESGADYTFTLLQQELEEYIKKYKADSIYVGTVGPCYIYPLYRENVREKFSSQEFGSEYPRIGYTWRPDDGDLEVTVNVGEIDDAAVFGFIYAIPQLDNPNGLPNRIFSGSCCGMFSIQL